MLYNSYVFIFVYLPIVLAGWYALNRFKMYNGSLVWLVMSSLFFYGYFNWSYLPVIVISIAVNYISGMLISPETKYIKRITIRKLLFIFSLVFNIGILFFYKYFGFLYKI